VYVYDDDDDDDRDMHHQEEDDAPTMEPRMVRPLSTVSKIWPPNKHTYRRTQKTRHTHTHAHTCTHAQGGKLISLQ
jgi:hypothetical protein